MRHLVVEPHADDAFLSLGGHIEQWVKSGDEVTIWTVYSGTRKRARDAEDYARAVGARWVGSGLVEGTAVEQIELPHEVLGQDQLYLPLAITHPEHITVRDILTPQIRQTWAAFYLDQPYAAVQRNGPRINTLLRDRRVLSFLRPPSLKYRHIPLFRDQAKFFHYNPAEKLAPNIELIVK